MDLVVKVEKVLDAQSFSTRDGSTMNRYGFVGVTDGEYAKHVKFDVLGDEKWSRMSGFHVGDSVQVSFDLSSREWNGRWFTQCDAYKVVVVSAGVQTAMQSVSASMGVQQAKRNTPNVDSQPF